MVSFEPIADLAKELSLLNRIGEVIVLLSVGSIFLTTGCKKSIDNTDNSQLLSNNISHNLGYNEKIKILILGRKTILLNGIPSGTYDFRKDGTYMVFSDPPFTQKYYVNGPHLCVVFEPTIEKCWKIDGIKQDGSLDATALSNKQRVRFVPSSKLEH